jgi:hypothetical protein
MSYAVRKHRYTEPRHRIRQTVAFSEVRQMVRCVAFGLAKLFWVAVAFTLLAVILVGTTYGSALDTEPPGVLGFDRNEYPGDGALAILRKNFAFSSYWLSPPPGGKVNTWRGKRELLRSHGFGFLVLYNGPESRRLKSVKAAEQKGEADARDAASSAHTEGFAAQTLIFLDIEEGGRLPKAYHAYLRAWTDELVRRGFRAGVYCSGMAASEGAGVTIVTSDDIRANIGPREMAYWIYNDACPPAPGCGNLRSVPKPSAGGVPYAEVWQISQSPRRTEFTAKCAATYHTDGNCYAPEDAAHLWFLDIDVANSDDPSGGKK